MVKFLTRFFFIGIALLVGMSTLSELSFTSLRSSNFYKPSFVTHLKEKNFDYVVLGSSTGLTTIDTKLLDSLSGLSGINLSMDDTALPSHYLMLEHFLETGHRTKKVVLTTTPWDLSESSPKIGNNDYRFLPFIHNEYVNSHFRSLNEKIMHPISSSEFFPFLGFSYYNTELIAPSLVSLVQPQKRNRFDSRGNYSYPKSNFKNEQQPIKIYKKDWINPFLKSIRRLCAQNDIELILYQSPIYRAKYSENTQNDNFVNHIDLLSSSDFFYDKIHVNIKGREIATNEFSKSLR